MGIATRTRGPSGPPHPGLTPLGVRPSLWAYLRSIWQRRDFAVAIAGGELRGQNMDTVLGNLWHILNPLLLAGVYYLMFGVILRGLLDRGVENFAAFIVIGVFAYHYSQKTVMGGAKAISDNEGLIRSIRFPRALLPLSVVLGQAFAFMPAVAVMLVITVVTGVTFGTGDFPHAGWLLLVPILLAQTLFNIGAAFVVARVGDSVRDVQHFLPYVFRLLFYLSGVLYPVTRFVAEDSPVRWLFDLNPFYVWVSLIRGPLLNDPLFPTLDVRLAVIGAVWAVVLLVAGFLYFRAGEAQYGRG